MQCSQDIRDFFLSSDSLKLLDFLLDCVLGLSLLLTLLEGECEVDVGDKLDARAEFYQLLWSVCAGCEILLLVLVCRLHDVFNRILCESRRHVLLVIKLERFLSVA
mgnify:CR=1 FL=1